MCQMPNAQMELPSAIWHAQTLCNKPSVAEMVNWQALRVPYLEGPIAARLGAEYNQRVYWCTATRFRSREFKRWRDANSWVRVVIYPGDSRRAREEARANRCLWDPKACLWYVEHTHESSLRPWHRAVTARGCSLLARQAARWCTSCAGSPSQTTTKRSTPARAGAQPTDAGRSRARDPCT